MASRVVRRLPRAACGAGLALGVLCAPVPLDAQVVATQVGAGGHHTCALLSDGRVQCWGANDSGQLGDGTTISRAAPVDVVGLPKARSLAVGHAHACALTESGAALCWGANGHGQLGEGSTRPFAPVPVRVSGLAANVRHVVAGTAHTCAVDALARAACWGSNAAGQLGDGTRTSHNLPALVDGLPAGVALLAAGNVNTIAVMADGRVYYWGRDGSTMRCDAVVCYPVPAFRTRPRAATFLPTTFIAVAADGGGDYDLAYTMCGLGATHGPVCWGGEYAGYGGESDVRLASPAGLVPPTTSITLGGDQSCALVGSGALQCWGRNDHGQLGRGVLATWPYWSPVPVPPLGTDEWTAVSSGWQHVCALTKAGAVKCWGNNDAGQVGNGGTSTPGESQPSAVHGLEGLPTAPVTLVEFHHAGLDHYFITWLAAEVAALDDGTTRPGWLRTGATFRAYAIAQPGTVPVCRYYLPPPIVSHFYGRNHDECRAVAERFPAFVLESSALVYAAPPAAGRCPADTQPVYRLFNGRMDVNHRYTIDPAIRDRMVAQGWIAEGEGPELVVMCTAR